MDDTIFSRGPARRPITRITDPTLQWSTGLPTLDRRLYAGWLCPTGQNEALDRAMEQIGVEQLTIKHSGGNVVTHWAIETANLFVLAEGIQTPSEMKHTLEWGCVWLAQAQRWTLAVAGSPAGVLARTVGSWLFRATAGDRQRNTDGRSARSTAAPIYGS